MVQITLIGAAGRMGGAILSCLGDQFSLVEAVDRPGSENIGRSLAEIHSSFKGETKIIETPSQPCDVVIDFAAGPGLTELVTLCVRHGWALISGRTGLSDDDHLALKKAAAQIAVLHAGNMSLGANLLMSLAARAAEALPEADIEILEAHHIHKKDAPSGTALAVAQAVAQVRRLTQEDYVYTRQGQMEPKKPHQIGLQALRSGETVGEHSVWYGLPNERLEITHKAFDRRLFAQGALTAAKWIKDQSPGHWAMKDVLGL